MSDLRLGDLPKRLRLGYPLLGYLLRSLRLTESRLNDLRLRDLRLKHLRLIALRLSGVGFRDLRLKSLRIGLLGGTADASLDAQRTGVRFGSGGTPRPGISEKRSHLGDQAGFLTADRPAVVQ